MLKKVMAGLLALVLCLSVCSVSFAEVYEFDAAVAGDMSFMATAEKAVSTEGNRSMAAAILMFEFLLYQAQNDIEMESRAVGNDCVIGNKGDLIAVGYDTGDGELILLLYDADAKIMTVGYMEASLENARLGFKNDGYTCYIVDANDWFDDLEQIFSIVLDEE